MSTNSKRPLFRPDSIALSVGVYSIANVALRSLGLIRMLALMWLMTKPEYGLLGIALLISNVLLPASTLGLYEGVARYAPHHESRGTLGRFSSSWLLIIVAMSVVFFAGIIAFTEPVSSLLFRADSASPTATPPDALRNLTRATLICVLTLAPYHATICLLRGLRMFRLLSMFELTAAVAFTALSIGAAYLGFGTAGTVMMSGAAAQVLAIAVFLPGLLLYCRSPQPSPPQTEASDYTPSRLLRFSAWAGATAVLWHALSYYPSWHLLKVTDENTVAPFHAVRTITQIVQIAAVMLASIVSANATKLWEQNGRPQALRQLSALSKASMLILFAGATTVAAASPLIIKTFPGSFASGRTIFEPLLVFFLLTAFIVLMTIRLNLIEKPRYVFLSWLVGAATNVAISCVLLGSPFAGAESAPAHALETAAWANVVGLAASALTLVVVLLRERIAPDTTTLVLMGLFGTVGLGWQVALPALIAALAFSYATGFVFTSEEKAALREVARIRRDR